MLGTYIQWKPRLLLLPTGGRRCCRRIPRSLVATLAACNDDSIVTGCGGSSQRRSRSRTHGSNRRRVLRVSIVALCRHVGQRRAAHALKPLPLSCRRLGAGLRVVGGRGECVG